MIMIVGLGPAISGVSGLLQSTIDKIWPNPEDKAKAEAIAMQSVAQSVVAKLEAEQAVMMAEAGSSDPWTSRARPSFLYVVYIILLASIPMGIVSAISPSTATDISVGFSSWLKGIPESITDLFTFVMLGYIGGRTYEKTKKVAR